MFFVICSTSVFKEALWVVVWVVVWVAVWAAVWAAAAECNPTFCSCNIASIAVLAVDVINRKAGDLYFFRSSAFLFFLKKYSPSI